jgi:hypothetical protein
MKYHNELLQAWCALDYKTKEAIRSSNYVEYLDSTGEWKRSIDTPSKRGLVYRALIQTEAELFLEKWKGKKICCSHQSMGSHEFIIPERIVDELIVGCDAKGETITWHMACTWQLWTPPEPKRIPLSPEDIKQGDAVRLKTWPIGVWEFAEPSVHSIALAEGDVRYRDLIEDYEIRSIGETEWRPCWKEEK